MKGKTVKRFTNESLSKKFVNNFHLVNYAISLAENMIRSGREPRVKRTTQNRAMLILEEIEEGKDVFDPIPEGIVRAQPSSFDGEQLKELMKEERSERRKRIVTDDII